jgi:hypothetical protein
MTLDFTTSNNYNVSLYYVLVVPVAGRPNDNSSTGREKYG